MSKQVFAVVCDECGVTVEVRGGSTADVLALLPQVNATLAVIDSQTSAVSATEPVHVQMAKALCMKHGVDVGANGQLIAALASLIQQLGPALQTLLPTIEAILALFGKTTPSAS